MEIQEGLGCCFWPFMLALFIIGLLTFPVGIIIWLIQGYTVWKILSTK